MLKVWKGTMINGPYFQFAASKHELEGGEAGERDDPFDTIEEITFANADELATYLTNLANR